MIFILFFNIKS